MTLMLSRSRFAGRNIKASRSNLVSISAFVPRTAELAESSVRQQGGNRCPSDYPMTSYAPSLIRVPTPPGMNCMKTLKDVRREYPLARAEIDDYAPFWVAAKYNDIQEGARRNDV